MIATAKSIVAAIDSEYVFTFGTDDAVNKFVDNVANGKTVVWMLPVTNNISSIQAFFATNTYTLEFIIATHSDFDAEWEERQATLESMESVANSLIGGYRDSEDFLNFEFGSARIDSDQFNINDANMDGVRLSLTFNAQTKIC